MPNDIRNIPTEPYGYVEGEVCKRPTDQFGNLHQGQKCTGVIEEHPKGGCCCHINPPCSACTEPRGYCPECGWEEKDEYHINGYDVQVDRNTGTYKSWVPTPLDPTKISYRVFSHTHFTQICEGICPEGTAREEILKQVDGTFGGRFEYFTGTKFKYIAYTD